MKHYGLIGYPLSHSFSEQYFSEKFSSLEINADYKKFEIYHLKSLEKLIKEYHLDGFNVTIPHKENVLNYLDHIDDMAKIIGAVNCVRVKNNQLSGYNTDIIGFEKSLYSFINSQPLKALVFGSGGASKAVAFVLNKLQIPFFIVSRNELQQTIPYSALNEEILSEYTLMINTTPIGMYPNVYEQLPIPYHFINETHYAFDLIYNPEKTMFLLSCEAKGARIKNGYEMLLIQAEESNKIFES